MSNHKWGSGDNLTGASEEGIGDSIAWGSREGNVGPSKEQNTETN